MAYIIGLLMAALSFLLNRALLKYAGVKSIFIYSPAVEEAAKTLMPFYLGADVIATHATFGLIEAVYDWSCFRYGSKAAILSIAGHSLFGMLTVIILKLTESIWLGLAGGIIAHMMWNMTVVKKTASYH